MPQSIENYTYLMRKLRFFENKPEYANLLAETQIQLKSIVDHIDLLPKSVYKTVLFMFYIENISITGIANYLHFSEIWVKKIKQKALKLYTKIYSDQ